ncbi:MAG: ABC transporter permease subunit [Candidatus Marinimicrobia bacterium]|nr:ABC transporter permease subunit [Candidatus Neomarinimicrobiota bacterium]
MPDSLQLQWRHVGLIFRKELAAYFNSTVAYITLVVFLAITGWFFSSSFFIINESDLRILFGVAPIIFLFFIPAITMGLVAREKSGGTMELLVTLPLADWEIVVGKFLAAVTLIAVALGFTLFHFLTLLGVATNIDIGAIIAGYLGLLLVGGVYAAAGVFCSSLSSNQITAFILSFLIVFVFFMLDKMLMFMPGFMTAFIQYISIEYHLGNISRGVIDSRNLVYFGSMIGLFLLLAIRVLEMRKWR